MPNIKNKESEDWSDEEALKFLNKMGFPNLAKALKTSTALFKEQSTQERVVKIATPSQGYGYKEQSKEEHKHKEGIVCVKCKYNGEIVSEDWAKDFVSKFFVYKLGGKFPDHVGAEKEAIAFIESLLRREKCKVLEKVGELADSVGHSFSEDVHYFIINPLNKS